jgi:hypothetical protein
MMTDYTGCNFYQQETEKHVPLYDKCNCDEDYVEEQWDSSIITAKQFLLHVQIQNPNLSMFYKLLFSSTLLPCSLWWKFLYQASVFSFFTF